MAEFLNQKGLRTHQGCKFQSNTINRILKSRLTRKAIDALKSEWHNFYSNNEENVIILNDGLAFQEASNTSVEMQLSQSKKSMNDSILDIFGVPKNWDWETFIKTAIMPILVAIECALNRDLLLEKEKKSFFFAFDTKEIIKGDIKVKKLKTLT